MHYFCATVNLGYEIGHHIPPNSPGECYNMSYFTMWLKLAEKLSFFSRILARALLESLEIWRFLGAANYFCGYGEIGRRTRFRF